MAFSVSKAIVAVLVILLGTNSAAAQSGSVLPRPEPPDEGLDTAVHEDCRAPKSLIFAVGDLPKVATALAEKRPIRVLALGPFPSGGFGSGPGTVSYPERLETELQKVLPDVPVEVEARRLSGETTTGAPETIMNAVMEVDPDLVVWNAGTHDALARVEIDAFAATTGEVLAWLRFHNMDVVVVEPPYAAAVADDEHYSAVVKSLREVAQRQRVPMVLRYEAMRYLSAQQAASAKQPFRLYDLSQRCSPEYVARAVAMSLSQGDRAPGRATGAPP